MLDSIKNRRSIRKFADGKAVTKEQITELLAAAMYAPSACNTRPWRFVAITDRAVLDKLADAHNYGKMLHTAPAAIVICALAEEQAKNEIARGFYPQDCAAATQNILLAADAMSLATCWCGVYPKENIMEQVRGILNLPADEVPFNIIAVGHAAGEFPAARGFYDEEKVRWV